MNYLVRIEKRDGKYLWLKVGYHQIPETVDHSGKATVFDSKNMAECISYFFWNCFWDKEKYKYREVISTKRVRS